MKRFALFPLLPAAASVAEPWAASGGMVAPNGDLWLLETSASNAVRVRRILSDGAERIY